MITTVRYGGEKQAADGARTTIPSRVALNAIGAMLQVTITHPQSVQAQLQESGRQVPAKAVKALIDTGASTTVITPGLASELGLVHTGYATIHSVQDQQERPVYYGLILFHWGGRAEIPMVACPLPGAPFDCLVGRDILMHWHLTYNGVDGFITICD